MLTSLGLIFIVGLTLGVVFKKLKLPSFIGMILTGVILSPYALNLLDDSLLAISPDLRKLALIIILLRAGLSLNMNDLKKVGRPAVLMCFLPATLEIVGTILIAPRLLDISLMEAAILGAIIAAVSPAVIIPRMIKLIEKGYGTHKSIPSLILASTSVDDIYVIILFSSFTSLVMGDGNVAKDLLQLPISILSGVLIGVVSGTLLTIFFRKVHMRDTLKIIIILSLSFLLIELESQLSEIISFSALLAIMSIGATLLKNYDVIAKRLSLRFSKLWVPAEVILFVLVGATVDLQYVKTAGFSAVLIVIGALMIRMLGVYICLIKTNLVFKEKIFCMLAYTPKATVQAAIGTIPLSMGMENGQIILTVAVLSILITAPIGAIGIDHSYKKLLNKG